ncbi:MAG: hypothetical protein PUD51_05370 [Prevotellaceae bacterium]|nr:hypothetical protein [Prevotellaceae bacterium]
MALVICLSACRQSNTEHTEVEETALEFAQAYFNYDFARAAEMATADSRKWLEFEASNISQADIDLLRRQDSGAEIVVTDTDSNGGNWASARLTARNFLVADTLGKAGHFVEEQDFDLKLQRDSAGRWRVRMEGPLRSGR